MKIEASKRTHVSAQKALTAAVETAIIIPEISEGDSRIRCPGVCASRLYFLLHFHNRSFESVRGCHAPVLGRQGTAEMRRRAPTYRERWVKNDDSGTLGFLFFQNQNAVQSGTAFSFYTIIDKKAAACKKPRAFYYRLDAPQDFATFIAPKVIFLLPSGKSQIASTPSSESTNARLSS